jgi:hypothetical protein
LRTFADTQTEKNFERGKYKSFFIQAITKKENILKIVLKNHKQHSRNPDICLCFRAHTLLEMRLDKDRIQEAYMAKIQYHTLFFFGFDRRGLGGAE